MPFGARQGPSRGVKAVKRGNAFVRMLLLIAFMGFLVAVVIATVFAGLVIAINGRLP
jgi:hypothetical protein